MPGLDVNTTFCTDPPPQIGRGFHGSGTAAPAAAANAANAIPNAPVFFAIAQRIACLLGGKYTIFGESLPATAADAKTWYNCARTKSQNDEQG
jgi:hypothetical protein